MRVINSVPHNGQLEMNMQTLFISIDCQTRASAHFIQIFTKSNIKNNKKTPHQIKADSQRKKMHE